MDVEIRQTEMERDGRWIDRVECRSRVYVEVQQAAAVLDSDRVGRLVNLHLLKTNGKY